MPKTKQSRTPKEKKSNIDRILARKDLMDVIFNHVANGGTLITLAQNFDIPFSKISLWVHKDEDREAMYVKALNCRHEWATQKILDEFEKLGYSDIRQLMDPETGGLLPVKDWPNDAAKSVKEIKIDELFESDGPRSKTLIGYTKHIKFWSKEKALEIMAKEKKMLIDKVEVSGKVTLEDLVLASFDDKEKPGGDKKS